MPATTVVEFDIGNNDMVVRAVQAQLRCQQYCECYHKDSCVLQRVKVPVGSNMLRAAEQAGVMTATR